MVYFVAALPLIVGIANANAQAIIAGLLFSGLAFWLAQVSPELALGAGILGAVLTILIVNSSRRQRDDERRHGELLDAVHMRSARIEHPDEVSRRLSFRRQLLVLMLLAMVSTVLALWLWPRRW